ncbi:MAG: PAS domain-containing protein [Xanthobacteraceae bacterium]|nr:PAS domain-containing protein [Xanthobacteraceae bacterium]
MAIEVFHGSTIPRELATAGLEYLWVKWRTLQATGGLTVHRLIDEAGTAFQPHCAFLMPDGDDFAYIYIGSALQDAIFRGPTATLLSADDSLIVRDLAEIYRRVIRDMTPAFTRFTSTSSPPGTMWHNAVMPVRISETSVVLVAYFELMSHQLEVYEHLFRLAPDAIAVACPITNDAGHVTDGWVLMMNDRARELLDYHGPLANLRLRALPQFNGVDLWGRIYAPRSAATTQVAAANFDVEILRFPHVLGLRLKPKQATIVASAPSLAPGLDGLDAHLAIK